ncbi:MAG: tetratricopeptide repeat protein [Candidatus Nitronauta litoralis]|uniref:Tetratricopeptide repeat protein n=1 Tax=Candidatus Nitronauta litoralis TaxID=2705533 RepID=A0A7T0BWE5_9BACT|nr:MAG: tetratricopeptide repeat protein [Candidatus Nitronauta litoralis]
MNNDPGSLHIRNWFTLLFFLLAAGFVYQNSFEGSFHSDDYSSIQYHSEIEQPGLFWRFPPHYRQWLTTSYALNFAQGGLDPFGYHAVNLALHLLTTCMLIALIRLTLKEGSGWTAQKSYRVALISGALFALHPVHTETVTYISGRSSGMSSLLYISALYFFATSQLKSNRYVKKVLAIFMVFLTGMGALLTKETCLTLPLGLLLFDFCFMQNNYWMPRSNRWKFLYGPLAAGSVIIILISPTFSTQVSIWLNRIQWNLILDQLPVLTYAFKLMFLPVNLTFDYDFPRNTFLSGFFKNLAILFWALILFAAWKFRKQSPPVFTFAVFWFLIILSPTNSILPRMDLLSERNLYLPSIGFCWWWGMLFNSLLEKKSSFRLVPVVASALAIVCLCYGLLTYQRNRVYLNDITLWQDTLTKSPNKSEVHYYLAMAHYLAGDPAASRLEITRLSKKDPSLAKKITASVEESQKQLESYLKLLENLKQVVQSDPGQFKMYGQVYRELAGLYRNSAPLYFTRLFMGAQLANKGRLQPAEVEFRKALTARPHLPHAHLDLAALFLRRGETEQAFNEMERAKDKMDLSPDLVPRWHLTHSRIFFSQRQFEEAKREVRQFLKTGSKNSEGYLLLGDIEMAQGHPDKAIAHWQLVTTPKLIKAEALFKTSMVHIQQNRIAEAQTELKKTLQLSPSNLAARFNLAKLILEHGGDKNLARHHLETILKSTSDQNKIKMVELLLSQISGEYALN